MSSMLVVNNNQVFRLNSSNRAIHFNCIQWVEMHILKKHHQIKPCYINKQNKFCSLHQAKKNYRKETVFFNFKIYFIVFTKT